MTSILVPINEVLFRNKNSFYNIFFSNKSYDFFGFWSSFDSSKFDWKKRNEIWEKIKKYNLECINTKTRWLIKNSKQNKMREIANNVIKNIENQDITKEKLPQIKLYPCYFKHVCLKIPHCKGCLFTKKITDCESESDSESESESESVRKIEIEEVLVNPNPKPSPDYRSKLISTLLKNENENENKNNNNNYTFFGIFFCGVGLGLGTYYFYRKS